MTAGLLLVLPSLSAVYAQPGSAYPFINRNANVVEFFGDSKNHWQSFCRILDTLFLSGDGSLDILHLGDSHVQADIFPHELRKGFQGFSPGMVNARGFVFPYPVAKTNNPENYKVTYTGTWNRCRSVTKYEGCSFGIAGINIQTLDSVSTITIRPNLTASDTYLTNSIKIFRNFDSGDFLINLLNYQGEVTYYNDTLNGFTALTISEYLQDVEFQFIRCDTLKNPFIIYGFILDNDLNGITYHTAGLNGAEIPSFNRCEFFGNDLRQINPGLVIISLGANDAGGPNLFISDFRKSLETLIDKIRSSGENPLILLTTPGDAYRRSRYHNTHVPQIGKVIHEVASEKGLAVWDYYTVMGGAKSVYQWYRNGLAQKDKLHLTRKGYQLQGQLLFEALMKAYTRSHQAENQPELLINTDLPQSN